jgi:indolepyruvate decarboxylase
MVDCAIDVPRAIIDWDGRLATPRSDDDKLAEAARETAARLNDARAPLIIVGIECHRYRLTREVVQLAERSGIPCVTTVLAKGAFPMDHPQYLGVYIGAISPPEIDRRVRRADVVLNLGTLMTDMNLGTRPLTIKPERFISAVDERVDVSFHSYNGVTLRDFVNQLLKCKLRRRRETVRYADNLRRQRKGLKRPVQVTDVLWELNRFLRGRKDFLVVAESGDALFAGLDIRVEGPAGYLAQGYYASMGFGVPGAIGAQIGTGKRPLVLCGDGAFQMTGPEIAHAPRHGTNPIVVLMNNGGWGIFRPVVERKDLLSIPPWPYAELAHAWGGAGMRVDTVGALRDALAVAGRCSSFVIIEVMIGSNDLSPVTRKYIGASAKHGAGASARRGAR